MALAFIPLAIRAELALAEAKPAREEAVVVTASGSHAFAVEIADTDETRARGLMFRRSLGAREGMLFFYPREQTITMWMKNTYLPLDMIFIRADGRVHRVEAHTEPFSEETISSGARVLSVLEVKAGTAEAIGLAPGDEVRHPRFGNAGPR